MLMVMESKPTPADMILKLRRVGLSSADIARWGERKGRNVSANTLRDIVATGKQRVSDDIRNTLDELYQRLCNDL